MGALWRLYNGLSLALGARRRFVRRIAGLCLVVLGVHAATDVLDGAVYQAVDFVDLILDSAAQSVLSWLGGVGALTPEAMGRHNAAFAALLDLEQKDWLSLRIALLVEVALDLLLLDFAWGSRDDDSAHRGIIAELKESAAELVGAFEKLDLERLAVLPTLFCLSLAGSLVAGVALESALSDLFARFAPLLWWGPNAAAATGLLAASVLVWRFMPDLLHGAILRSRERGAAAHDRALAVQAPAPGAKLPRFPQLERVRLLVRVKSRGTWLLLVALPLAVVSLLSQTDVMAMVARLGSSP